jgi:parallel beta-helix repeat protein/predicted outer membrane repeat protein
MVTFFKKIILCLIICFSFFMAKAQTHIYAGNLSGTELHWQASDNPYYIHGDITVTNTDILHINEGVEAYFYPGTSLTVDVNASVLAYGTHNYPILLTEFTLGSGWLGINISNNNNAQATTFNYCTVENVNKSGPCNGLSSTCGAVYISSSSNLSFSNCTFNNNEVCSGGGIYSTSSEVNINNCTFLNNEVVEDGGGVFVDNPSTSTNFYMNTFESNDANGNGGGMYISNCSNQISFEGNSFTNNTALLGGGIYISLTAISDFLSNDFDNNDATDHGGGICLVESSIVCKLSEILENQALSGEGGGIYILGTHSSGSSNKFLNSLIAQNVAYSNGGGIYSDQDFVSCNNTIADNQAQNGAGGGIFNGSPNGDITNTIIWGNTATSNPQAFPDPDGNDGYSYSCTPSIVNCPTCTTSAPDFIGNGNYRVSYVSPCYNAGDNSVQYLTVDLDDVNRVINNTIDIGAYEDQTIHVPCGQLTSLSWTDHNDNGIDYIVNCDIEIASGQTLTIGPGTEIAFNGAYKLDINGVMVISASQGEIVKFNATSGNTWKGVRIINNSNTMNIHHCEFTDIFKHTTGSCAVNADYAGSIYIENSSNITLSNNIIHDNEVCSQGGGIYVTTSSSINISFNEIYDNIAYSDGGGISIGTSTSAIAVYNNLIDNNLSVDNGGGIANQSGYSPVFHNNVISNNQARDNGGGIYMNNGSATEIYNCTVVNNSVNNGVGGGFYHDDNSYVLCINNILWDNVAPQNDNVFMHTGCTYTYENNISDYTTINSLTCTDCISENPVFYSTVDFTPTSFTSCFENGQSLTFPTSYDFNGKDRLVNTDYDIGAIEMQSEIVCGSIPNNQTWTDRNEYGIDYYVPCNIDIPSANTLNIDPGTTIGFEESISLTINGTLNAIGNSQNRIVFTAVDQNDGWYGLMFGKYTTSNTYDGLSILDYCNIEFVNKNNQSSTTNNYHENYNGAIYIYSGSNAEIEISNCIIQNNQVPGYGGGIQCIDCLEDIKINGNNITQNSSSLKGGGISISHYISRCKVEILNNNITNNSTYIGGGGIWIDNIYGLGNDVLISGNYIYNNTTYGDNSSILGTLTGSGGGIGFNTSTPLIINNIIDNNFSYETSTSFNFGVGGGIYMIGDMFSFYQPMILNNQITNNYAEVNGGAIYLKNFMFPRIYNCTIVKNRVENNPGMAGGVAFIRSNGYPVFKNTIAYYNIPQGTDVLNNGQKLDPDEFLSYTTYSIIENFDAPYVSSTYHNNNYIPQFVDYQNNDFRISCSNNSPAIDEGDDATYNSFSSIIPFDIRGEGYSRQVDAVTGGNKLDIGAYEYEFTDCDNPPTAQYRKSIIDSSLSINIEADKIKIYPNPADDWFNISISSDSEKSVRYSIYNNLGQHKYTNVLYLNKGENIFILNCNTYDKGLYLLVFEKINKKFKLIVK